MQVFPNYSSFRSKCSTITIGMMNSSTNFRSLDPLGALESSRDGTARFEPIETAGTRACLGPAVPYVRPERVGPLSGSLSSSPLSDSASTCSSISQSDLTESAPESNLQLELSELGLSLAKLALHAEGAPIIVCEEGDSNGNSGKRSHGSNMSNSTGNTTRYPRRRSYRVLQPPPMQPPYVLYDMNERNMAAPCFAYQPRFGPSLIPVPITFQPHSLAAYFDPNYGGQLFLHHHHHFHYHHHVHQPTSRQPTEPIYHEAELCQCEQDNTVSSNSSSRVHYVKGDDLIMYQQNSSSSTPSPTEWSEHFRGAKSHFRDSRARLSTDTVIAFQSASRFAVPSGPLLPHPHQSYLSTGCEHETDSCSISLSTTSSEELDIMPSPSMSSSSSFYHDATGHDSALPSTGSGLSSDDDEFLHKPSTSSNRGTGRDRATGETQKSLDNLGRMSFPRPIKARKRKRKTERIGVATCKVKPKFPDVAVPTRPWIPLNTPTAGHHVTNVFTVMCYNVLCDKYATRQLYGYCPNWVLSWENRRQAIMAELKRYDADIISLQEVETEQFYQFFNQELGRNGYNGIFSPKSRAKTMTEQERRHVDGCAIFFKSDKFELIKEHLIEFNQLAMANAEGSDDMLNRVMTKDNIGLAALLRTKEVANKDYDNGPPSDDSPMETFESQPLIVCTAHIHWDPEFCDVKLIQTMMLMHELRNFVDNAAACFDMVPNGSTGSIKADPNSIPVILCGDLNSLPHSGVVEFLTKGRISVEHADFKELAYRDCLRRLCPVVDKNTNDYTHPFDMVKAYQDDIMPFTNYTYDFKGVIDYIFCSRQLMSVLGVLGPLDPKWFQINKVAGCPHQHIPSDHFPLVVELELLSKKSQTERKEKEKAVGVGATNGHMLRRG